ncbi:MAG: hypothetical protein CR988_03420 [Treponema sp.]|nr:MAG: hypothetical protein CR988_03420 [Treponema sp.]
MKQIEKIILICLGVLLLASTCLGFYRLVNQNSRDNQYILDVLTEYEISALKFKSNVYSLALSENKFDVRDFEKQISIQDNLLKNLKLIINEYSGFLNRVKLDRGVEKYILSCEKTLNKLALWKQEYSKIQDRSESSITAIEKNFLEQHKLYKNNQQKFLESDIIETQKNIMLSGLIIILAWVLAIFLTYRLCKEKFTIIISSLRSKPHKKIRLSVGEKKAKFTQSTVSLVETKSTTNFDINSNDIKNTELNFFQGDSETNNVTPSTKESISEQSTPVNIQNSEQKLKPDFPDFELNNTKTSYNSNFNYNNLNFENAKIEAEKKVDVAKKTSEPEIYSEKLYVNSENSNETKNDDASFTQSGNSIFSTAQKIEQDIAISQNTNNNSENNLQIEKLKTELEKIKTANDELQKINTDITTAYENLKLKCESDNFKLKEESGKKLIDEIHASIETGQKDTEQAKELMHAFEESANIFKTTNERIVYTTQSVARITEIGELIDGIADQIKMLSMNAAIEAAHAGNAGKGFAVVAEEMGRLAEAAAENSQGITKTVKELVKDITFIGKSGGDLEKAFEKLNIQTGKVYESIQTFSTKIKTNYEKYLQIDDQKI